MLLHGSDSSGDEENDGGLDLGDNDLSPLDAKGQITQPVNPLKLLVRFNPQILIQEIFPHSKHFMGQYQLWGLDPWPLMFVQNSARELPNSIH